MAKKKRMMLLTRKKPGCIESFQVEVLAVVGVNAIVRRLGCGAFVAHTKQLSEVPCVEQ